MSNRSGIVRSNQNGVHKDLEQLIFKHITCPYLKPYREFSEKIFDQLDEIQQSLNKPIILDSGCGTGESSVSLAKKFPKKLIIGIDKSEKRLEKFFSNKLIYYEKNLILARADVVDVWRLAKIRKWNITKHYLFYPNPWPKKDQIKRRWHGHPVFPEMVSLCSKIELRTNWQIYAEEFKQAVEIVTNKTVSLEEVNVKDFISPFEKKYYESGHELYKVYFS